MRPLKQAVYTSRTADKFVVRLPDGMRERVAEVARKNHRSMNSEIIARLDESMSAGEVNTNIDPNSVTIHERRLLESFRKLGAGKRKALMLLCTDDEEAGAEDSSQ
ncbi:MULTISPECIES: Arc family DNA-binding protein [Pseudomonas]|uniref:DNA-binding protein n=1 Tax=Pseudomonas fluorescens TaxID=294 RepID=A0A166QMW2_PSEFL|nr:MULTISPECIES: Arc family DNA-binding protein [Pseudomonas]KZN20551.1 DNA-binding protein [Pseudomonas fluorescens]